MDPRLVMAIAVDDSDLDHEEAKFHFRVYGGTCYPHRDTLAGIPPWEVSSTGEVKAHPGGHYLLRTICHVVQKVLDEHPRQFTKEQALLFTHQVTAPLYFEQNHPDLANYIATMALRICLLLPTKVWRIQLLTVRKRMLYVLLND